MKRWLAKILAAAALLSGAASAVFAASSATVNISVSINANLSVTVDDAISSTQAVVWNAAVPNAKLAGSSATVVNDSGGLTEKWSLATNPESINTAGGSDRWALAASTQAVGADQFAVQAVFGSSNTALSGAGSCPAAGDADWDQDYAVALTAAAQTYTSTRFADPNLNHEGGTPYPDLTDGAADGRMFAGSRRALCWRIVTPSSTSTTQTQNIQVIVTATLP